MRIELEKCERIVVPYEQWRHRSSTAGYQGKCYRCKGEATFDLILKDKNNVVKTYAVCTEHVPVAKIKN